jgi:hypothetical protein
MTTNPQTPAQDPQSTIQKSLFSLLVLNYSHPLTAAHRADIEALTGSAIAEVRDIPTQLDPETPFGPQIVALAEAAELTPAQWQTQALLVVLPALNYAAALLLAELHGRMGYFPPVVRLRPVAGALPPRYEVAEVLDVQTQRAEARQRRTA